MQQSFQRADFLQPFHLKGLSISSDKNKYIKNVTLQQHVFISNKFLCIPGNGGGLVGQAGAVKKNYYQLSMLQTYQTSLPIATLT